MDFSFKVPNEISYQRYRVVFQVLDALALKIDTYHFNSRLIIASILYLVIGGPHMMGVFDYDY